MSRFLNISEERQILLKETSLEGTAWLVALLYYMTMFETGAKLIIEAPEQGLNLNQQKMLSEMMVLYEAVDGVVAITKSDSPYFQINQAEALPQADHRD